jgi:hypothetical protein
LSRRAVLDFQQSEGHRLDARTIEWMKASARIQAFGRGSGKVTVPPADWTTTFGSLASGDNYFMVYNSTISDMYGCMRAGAGRCSGIPSRDWYDWDSAADIGGDFAINVFRSRATLITVAKHDGMISSRMIADGLSTGAIPHVLRCPQPNGFCGAMYTSRSTMCSLPGIMTIFYDPIDGHMGEFTAVTMPTGYSAGHSVTMRDGDKFKAGVQAWFESTKNP